MRGAGRTAFGRLGGALAVAVLAGCVDSPATYLGVGSYSVSGRSLPQLLAATKVHGPAVGGTTRRAFAGVAPKIAVSFTPRQVGRTCRYDPRGKVELSTFMVLPDWRGQKRASPEVALKWEAITRYAIAHELVHVSLFQRQARRLETAYRSLSAADCATLERLLAREAQRDAVASDAQHQAFDRFDYPRFSAFISAVDAY